MNCRVLFAVFALAASGQSAPPLEAKPATTPPITPTPASITTPLDGVIVTAKRLQDSAQVGEAVHYELLFQPSREGTRTDSINGVRIESVETLGNFDVLAITQPQQTPDGRIVGDLLLMTLETGTQMPDSISLRLRDPLHGNAEERSAEVLLPTIEITSIVGSDTDPAQYRDIAGVIEVPSLRAWAPYAIAAAVLAAVFAAAMYLWLRRRTRRAIVISADAWAICELDRLKAEAMPARGAFGPYYDGLTRIIRHYVALRYAISAESQTSREFISNAQEHAEFPQEETARLRELLRLADLVKFARATPEANECDAHLAHAREFIEHTRSVATPSPTEAPR